jgi:hypothetical protein
MHTYDHDNLLVMPSVALAHVPGTLLLKDRQVVFEESNKRIYQPSIMSPGTSK